MNPGPGFYFFPPPIFVTPEQLVVQQQLWQQQHEAALRAANLSAWAQQPDELEAARLKAEATQEHESIPKPAAWSSQPQQSKASHSPSPSSALPSANADRPVPSGPRAASRDTSPSLSRELAWGRANTQLDLDDPSTISLFPSTLPLLPALAGHFMRLRGAPVSKRQNRAEMAREVLVISKELDRPWKDLRELFAEWELAGLGRGGLKERQETEVVQPREEEEQARKKQKREQRKTPGPAAESSFPFQVARSAAPSPPIATSSPAPVPTARSSLVPAAPLASSSGVHHPSVPTALLARNLSHLLRVHHPLYLSRAYVRCFELLEADQPSLLPNWMPPQRFWVLMERFEKWRIEGRVWSKARFVAEGSGLSLDPAVLRKVFESWTDGVQREPPCDVDARVMIDLTDSPPPPPGRPLPCPPLAQSSHLRSEGFQPPFFIKSTTPFTPEETRAINNLTRYGALALPVRFADIPVRERHIHFAAKLPALFPLLLPYIPPPLSQEAAWRLTGAYRTLRQTPRAWPLDKYYEIADPVGMSWRVLKEVFERWDEVRLKKDTTAADDRHNALEFRPYLVPGEDSTDLHVVDGLV